ncbi:MAG: PASTA domain-containing protein [Treponema sp.]|nr:PASTA domain-containing protein [Treponema sp.]
MSLKDKIKNFNIKNCRVSFLNTMEKLQANGKSLVLLIFSAVVVMFIACLAVFFAFVKSPEQVMVPDLEGKLWSEALMEMQAKELYPRVQLRYTDSPDDEGKILNQNPIAGAIVKAGTRVTLTISRGIVIDHVENYVGMKLDEVRLKLQTMFTGSARPLIVLNNPVYKPDQAEAGVILEQDPPEGTIISSPVTVQLVVSRGPDYEQTRVPNLVGKTVNDVLSQIGQSRLIYDFVSHLASGDEKPGTVTGQETFKTDYVKNYTRVQVELAMPAKSDDGMVYGIFSEQLTEYPYPVSMSLDAVPDGGNRYNLVTLNHTGGSLTIPYAVPRGTELVFTVVGREVRHITVR